MGPPMILKLVLTDGTCQRLTFSSGLPESIEDLICEVKRQCCLQGNFRLQFMDSFFVKEFLNFTSISEIAAKETLKVIDMSRPTIMKHKDSIVLDHVQDSKVPSVLSVSHSSLDGYVDIDVLLSSESTSSRSSWPAVFYEPKFPYDSESKPQQASMEYNQNRTVPIPDPKLKSVILYGLMQEIVIKKRSCSESGQEASLSN